ncbi:MAG: T9SS type A sorting domain-containing protein [Bacteroidetes bacterium]|nr:T9SS type A sorting domain-containing protein [Bacteroidota bacterium]
MKTIITLALCVVISLSLRAAGTLTYKFANPHIETYSPDNYLVFDVLVKANTGGTYLYASQVICNIALANFNTAIAPSVEKGFVDGTFDPPGPASAQVKYNATANYNSGNLNIAVLANNGFNGSAPASGAYAEVTTSWQKLCTVYCAISNTAGVAGISFQVAAMNGYQKYASGVGPLWSAYYYSPNIYEGYDLTDLYLARIFCGQWGWTQINGSVDWTTAVNTSVWDTTTVAALAGDVSHPNVLANGLRIHPNGRLKVPEGRSISCSGPTDIKEPRGLILAAGSTGRSQFLDNGTINYANNGTVEAQCFYPRNMWHYYCIPLESTAALPYLFVYMKYYQVSNHNYKYVVAPDSILSTKMLGYAMWATSSGQYTTSGLVTPIGKLNTGSITASLGYNGSDGYNLIGNPFPSALDLSSTGVNFGDCQPKAWFFNPSSNNYEVYLKAGGGTRTTSFCAAEQAFFVLANSATSFSVNNSARSINSVPFLKDGIELHDMLKLTASCDGNSDYDKSVIRFAPEASTSYDNDYDAYKLSGSYEAPQLFSLLDDQTKLSVNTQPWTDQNQVVKLGFSCGKNSNYTITADNFQSFNDNISIYLEDKLLNVTQDLRKNASYSFSANVGDQNDRFLIHVMNPTFGIGEIGMNSLQVYQSGGILYVRNADLGAQQGEIQVFDMLGQKVFQDKVYNSLLNSYSINLPMGYYLVRVISGNTFLTKKVLF